MAERPVYIVENFKVGVKIISPTFKWYSGYAVSQKQKSIRSLHEAAKKFGVHKTLEISSKSEDEIGQKLSAFNLSAKTINTEKNFTVETAFQSSKIFELGGPYSDLLFADSRSAKKDDRIQLSGKLIGFQFSGKTFPLQPLTYFYDWLYAQFLLTNIDIAKELLNYDSFTDIEFNPEKSVNCQAHAAALFASMKRQNVVDDDLKNPLNFLNIASSYYKINNTIQINTGCVTNNTELNLSY